jgi:hypothetical protein
LASGRSVGQPASTIQPDSFLQPTKGKIMTATTKPAICPKCRGHKVASNACLSHAGEHSAMHGTMHYAHHHPLAAAVIGAFWLVGKVINTASEKWKCEGCGHKWS